MLSLIAEAGAVIVWRSWSPSAKRAIQSLAPPLARNPIWLAAEDTALHLPTLTYMVVLPVEGAYWKFDGNVLHVAHKVYSDATLFRESVLSI
ncbi:hypothetical protein Lsed01_02278 [Demequina sediminis]|uniref:Uncharacterized protein n=1 Tax=Demequina sediminis TaxID=1930058 RepID=A0ABP9WIZ8_9MICO|nr:hypothetical protein [Demequina sediminis]BDZ60585.1 hypothetical protein GCM10025873_03760 [Demequina sediminis]